MGNSSAKPAKPSPEPSSQRPQTTQQWSLTDETVQQVISHTVAFGAGILFCNIAMTRFRRVPTAAHWIPDWTARGRRLRGLVVKVGDSDNFRVRRL
jgi:hypothetical protein